MGHFPVFLAAERIVDCVPSFFQNEHLFAQNRGVPDPVLIDTTPSLHPLLHGNTRGRGWVGVAGAALWAAVGLRRVQGCVGEMLTAVGLLVLLG